MNPEQLFDDIAQFVAESRALLKKGAVMDLAGLDQRVMLLCEEALLLPQSERVRYAKQLQQLLNDLNALGKELEASRDAVAEEMRNTPQHKKAHVAYRKTEASDKKEEE